MDARRLIPIGAVVTALLVVAAIASHGRPLSPGHGAGPTASFFDYVLTTLVLFAAATVVVALWALRGDRAGGGPPRRGKWHIWTQFLLVGGAILIAELLMHTKFEQRLKSLAQQHGKQERQVPPYTQPTGAHGRNAHVRWDEIAIVLAIVLIAAAYFWFTRPARKPLRELVRRRSALSRALDDSLDDLRSDPDVRRAIIAAYARMERALGAAGLPRSPAEAPFEYLARSLVELDASRNAAERLTGLFERAKFSHHELGEPMRDEAIGALVAVRDDLQRAVAQPVPA